jgi:hydroxymethylbilane synthase
VRPDAIDENCEPLPIKQGGVVGTSAVRRAAQLAAMQPELTLKDVRGNVPTRVRKLADGDYDAIFLASAGVRRLELDLSDFRVLRLEPESFVPSPAQGALAVEMRGDHPRADEVRAAVHDEETAIAVAAERSVLAAFGGGCSLPLGAHVVRDGAAWRLIGFWDDPEHGPCWDSEEGGDALALADRLVPRLKEGGAA